MSDQITDPAALPENLSVDGYTVVGKIGEGGMGAIYEVRRARLEGSYALKVFSLSLSAGASEAQQKLHTQMLARFEGESRAASRIGHPNIVQVFDSGQLPDQRPYLVMEHLRGENLEQALARRGALGPAEAWVILNQLCLGLSAAHAAKIVHRDLKPENVFLVRLDDAAPDDLHVKILDFGIAKDLTKKSVTVYGGDVFGSPEYMSPEQWRSEVPDQRTDIYALGAIIYRCLVGRPPFSGDLAQLPYLHLETPAQIPRALEAANPALAKLILDCLQKLPANRPPDVATVRKRLQQCLTAPPVAPAPVAPPAPRSPVELQPSPPPSPPPPAHGTAHSVAALAPAHAAQVAPPSKDGRSWVTSVAMVVALIAVALWLLRAELGLVRSDKPATPPSGASDPVASPAPPQQAPSPPPAPVAKPKAVKPKVTKPAAAAPVPPARDAGATPPPAGAAAAAASPAAKKKPRRPVPSPYQHPNYAPDGTPLPRNRTFEPDQPKPLPRPRELTQPTSAPNP